MSEKITVVALGHRALGTTLPEQKIAAKKAAKAIADLVEAGNRVVAGQRRIVRGCLCDYQFHEAGGVGTPARTLQLSDGRGQERRLRQCHRTANRPL